MLSRSKSKTLRAQKQPGPQSSLSPSNSLSPLHQSNPQSVTTAAQAAFSNFQNQYAAATAPSLSTAAAAAALRNNPTPRTNVAQVQTKRNLRRRSSSVSSAASSRRGFSLLSHLGSSSSSPVPPPRSPSVSSMTRRTLRSPSPSPSLGAATTASMTTTFPKSLRTPSVASSAGRSHKRSSSEHMSGAYAATNVDMSVPLDAAVITGQPTRPRASSHSSRPTSPSPSINFSYPRLNKAASPDAIVEEPGDTMVYDANSRRLVPKSQLDALNRDLQIAGENTTTPGPEKGSRRGTRARPKSGSTFSPAHSHATSSAAATSATARPASLSSAHLDTGSASPSSSIATAQPLLQPAQTRQSQLVQLGDVHDPHSLSHQDASPAYAPHHHSHAQSDSQPHSHALGHSSGSAVHPKSASAAAAERPSSPSYSSLPERKSVFIQDQSVDSVRFVSPHGSPRAATSHFPASLASSGRSPSASQQPSAADTEMPAPPTVRHAPTGRSAPPRKPALKNPHAASSSAQSGLAHGKPGSISDDGSVSAEIPNGKRVSFDHQDTFVPPDDHYASDSGSFTQKMRRRWLSGLGRSRKKDREDKEEPQSEPEPEREHMVMIPSRPDPTAEDIRREDPDPFTGMGTLPTLPNFNDIFRGHKRDDSGVSSKEDARKNATASPSRPASSYDYPGPESHHLPTIRSGTELNTDYLEADPHFDLEDIVMMDARPQVFKHEANTSRFREPLPPIVTSVDGTGFSTPSPISDYSEDVSGSGSGLDSMDDFNPSVPPIVPDAPANTNSPNYPPGFKSESLTVPQVVPAVQSFSQQSNTADATPSVSSAREFSVPGSFPRDSNTTLDTTDEATSVQDTSKLTAQDKAEEASSPPPRSVRFADDLPTRATEQEDDDSDTDSDGSSVYSDAYESFDNGGFQSLNAVVMASPIVPSLTMEPIVQTINSPPPVTPLSTVSETVFETPSKDLSLQGKEASVEMPSLPTQSSIIYNTAVSHNVMTLQNSEMDWERAKEYWRSLSPEKRRQLELEALEGQDSQTPMSPLSVASGLVESPSDILGQTFETNATAQVVPGIGSQYQQVRHVSPNASVSNEDGGSPQAATSTDPKNLKKTLGAAGNKVKKSPRSQDAVAKDVRHKTLQKKARRPVSHSAPLSQPFLSPSERRQRHASLDNPLGVSIVEVTRTSLSRQGSNSSFDRNRSKPRGGGGFGTFGGLRSSMRDSSVSSAEQAVTSKPSRFSIRSLSPQRNGPVSSTPGMGATAAVEGGLRKTMRPEPSGDKKGFFGRAKRSSFSLGSSNKKASRFVDSSDEEGNAGDNVISFQSRFADSSDEDEAPAQSAAKAAKAARRASAPQPLSSHPINANVIGAVHKPLVQSNQIPDSQRNPSPMPSNSSQAMNSQIINSSGKGVIRMTSLRNTNSQRAKESKGFMRALRRRNVTTNKIHRAPPGESAARRDTPLERDASQITALRQSGSEESDGRDAAMGAEDDELSIHEDANDFEMPTSSSDPTGTATASGMGAPWPLSGASRGSISLGTSSVVRACGGSVHSLGSSVNVSSAHNTHGNNNNHGNGSNNNNAPLPSFTAAAITGTRNGMASLDLPGSGQYGAEDGPAGAGGKKKFGKLRKMFRKTE